jgi:AcrR family transcriptional regulator
MTSDAPEKRRYRSPERAERANRTRAAILDAAQMVFWERGYLGATMQAVADQTGVSVATVYLHFRSRSALVRGLADEVTGAVDLSVTRVLSEPDSRRQLEIGARILRKLHERSEVVVEVLRVAASSDSDLMAELRRWREQHLQAVAAVARSLGDRHALRSDINLSTATDVLYTIGGPDTFRQLVRERGWRAARYERWLVEAAERLLLARDGELDP